MEYKPVFISFNDPIRWEVLKDFIDLQAILSDAEYLFRQGEYAESFDKLDEAILDLDRLTELVAKYIPMEERDER